MRSTITAPKKAQGTSVLKNLPDDRQDAILEYYETHKGTDTVQWLAAGNIKTSTASLSTWRSWYLEKRILDRRERAIVRSLWDHKLLHPDTTKKELDEMGEFIFNALAIKQRDVKTWHITQQVQLKRERQVQQQILVDNATRRLELEERKYKDHKVKPTKRDRTAVPTPKEKKAAVRKILGIS